MQGNRAHLGAVYSAVLPEVEAETSKGVDFAMCFACGFPTAQIDEIAEPLYQAVCRVCGADRKFLQVPCPECEAIITVEDLGEGKCPNDAFTTDIDWLVDKYGPYQDPKEDSEVAYCTECDHTQSPSAIPWGDEYLCLSCLTVHDSAEMCDWCGALNASLAEHSYLTGCAMCDGQFGSESFARD